MILTLLGLPPTTNNLYAVVGKRHVLTEEGDRYHQQVREVVKELYSLPPADGPFAVSVTYYLGGYERDVEGSHKALIDGMSGLVWNDDRQIQLMCLRKRKAPAGMLPYVNVITRKLAQQPASMRQLPGTPREPDRGLTLVTGVIPPTNNNIYFSAESRIKTPAAQLAGRLFSRAFDNLSASSDLALPWSGHLGGKIRYYFAADRRDVDGSHKLLLDAAKGILWHDDRQLTHICLRKGKSGGETPTIFAAFWPVGEDAAAQVRLSKITAPAKRTRSINSLHSALNRLAEGD